MCWLVLFVWLRAHCLGGELWFRKLNAGLYFRCCQAFSISGTFNSLIQWMKLSLVNWKTKAKVRQRPHFHIWVGDFAEVSFFHNLSRPSVGLKGLHSFETPDNLAMLGFFSQTRFCEDRWRFAENTCRGATGIIKNSNNNCWKTTTSLQEAVLQSRVWDQEGLPGQSHLRQVRTRRPGCSAEPHHFCEAREIYLPWFLLGLRNSVTLV